MSICEKCREVGECHCETCPLGNPCLGCLDYDEENNTCISKGACGGIN